MLRLSDDLQGAHDLVLSLLRYVIASDVGAAHACSRKQTPCSLRFPGVAEDYIPIAPEVVLIVTPKDMVGLHLAFFGISHYRLAHHTLFKRRAGWCVGVV